jgi:hypothetical protein
VKFDRPVKLPGPDTGVPKRVVDALKKNPPPDYFRRNKYRAIKTVVDGITFHSKGEAMRYSELKFLEKAGKIKGLRLQVDYPLNVSTHHICSYIADFVYYSISGDGKVGMVIEDYKGVRTDVYRLKKKLFEALYAPLTITETGRTSKRGRRKRKKS